MAWFSEDLTQCMHLWKSHLRSVYKWLSHPLLYLVSIMTYVEDFIIFVLQMRKNSDSRRMGKLLKVTR